MSPCLLVCLCAGCGTDFGTRQQGDPLLGINATPKPIAGANASGNATSLVSTGPIPAMPASYSAPSTAPVAGGEVATPENPRELRMPGDSVAPTNMTPTGAARGVAPAVNVGTPEPVPTGTTSNLATRPASSGLATPLPASAPPSGTAANLRSFEEAQNFLKQHGVTYQSMSQEEQEWKFECSIPNPGNPHMNKTYKTSRPFSDPLSAMRAVIAQIEQKPL